MKVNEFQLGMRVRRRSGENAFVRDPAGGQVHRHRYIGIVVSLPRRLARQHYVVDIQWERSSRTEAVHVFRLEPLPLPEQPVALGGKWKADADTFVAKRTTST